MTRSIPAKNSVLSMIPATGTIEFTHEGETWTEPVVALAVTVDEVLYRPEDNHGDTPAVWTIDSAVEPVVLEEGHPFTITYYLMDKPHMSWRWIPA